MVPKRVGVTIYSNMVSKSEKVHLKVLDVYKQNVNDIISKMYSHCGQVYCFPADFRSQFIQSVS